jgi:hypothetical protein
MARSTKQGRLDALEVELTPKQWAIRLADEMRRHPSEADFLKAIAEGTYRKSPYIKPFYVLAEQAEARYPGNSPEDIRARDQLNKKLRMEFHALKGLIVNVNETMMSKSETNGLKAALKLSTLHSMILQDAFGRTSRKAAAWVEEYKSAGADEKQERQATLRELAAYGGMSFVDAPSGSLTLDRSLCLRPCRIEIWVDELTMLVMDVFGHKAAVQAIQDKYFDGHPILFHNVEAKLAETIQAIEGAAATFNEYLKTRADLFSRERNPEEMYGIASAIPGEREGHLVIDIEAIQGRAKDFVVDCIAAEWVKYAKEKAVGDILEETQEHQEYVWRNLQEQVGAKA